MGAGAVESRVRTDVGLALAVLSAATFGTSGSLATSLIRVGWTPGAAVLVRVLIATLVLTIPALIQLRAKPLTRRSSRVVLFYGVVAVAGAQLGYFNAVKHLSVAVALLLEYSGIVLVVGWQWLRHHHRPSRLTLAGAGLALLGLVFVLDLLGSHHLDVVGVLWGLGAAVGLAVYFVVSAEAKEGPAPLVMAWGGLATGTVVLALAAAVGVMPVAAPRRDVVLAHHHVSWLVPVLGIALVAAVVAFVAGIAAARILGAKLASFLGLTEVLFAVAFAWLLLGQGVDLVQAIGGLFVLGGIALVRLDELRVTIRPRRLAAVTAALALLAVTVALPAGRTANAQTTPSPAKLAAAAYSRMTPQQRIGQLFMVGASDYKSTSTARAVMARYYVGSAIFIGLTHAGVDAVADHIRPVRKTTTQAGVAPFISVDQEGGEVQHLQGPGFWTMPTALKQGQRDTTTLRGNWMHWSRQLRRAGVNLDLAPIGDTVPASVGRSNQPIGRYDREYGYTPEVVSPHIVAAIHGMHDAGIGSTVKHFPGLGRATGNTDTARGVTDPTTSTDAYLAPYQVAIKAGVPAVMVSTAIYPNIDPGVIGAFSHPIVTELLRDKLGFQGLIVSDSLNTVAVGAYTPGDRAILSLDAGVDIILVTKTAPVGPMATAIRARTASDADFARVVKNAVMRVLVAKAKAGLVASRV
jgi:beta-glucosidase-like glycosyl hydrolase/drug/metabolite transporter (DMT)-like permease